MAFEEETHRQEQLGVAGAQRLRVFTALVGVLFASVLWAGTHPASAQAGWRLQSVACPSASA